MAFPRSYSRRIQLNENIVIGIGVTLLAAGVGFGMNGHYLIATILAVAAVGTILAGAATIE